MMLTKEIVIKRGFKLSPNSATHYHLNHLDHASICFYCWDHMIITVEGKQLKGDRLTTEQFEAFYEKVTGKKLGLSPHANPE